jgi:hypothetical protein
MYGSPPPPPDLDRTLPRRVSLLDKIPKAPPTEPASKTPLLLLGSGLGIAAAAMIVFAVMQHSWGWAVGGAVLLALVVRALRQWHA